MHLGLLQVDWEWEDEDRREGVSRLLVRRNCIHSEYLSVVVDPPSTRIDKGHDATATLHPTDLVQCHSLDSVHGSTGDTASMVYKAENSDWSACGQVPPIYLHLWLPKRTPA